MRILYLDLDTLRPDHLGCYGYHRNTSPNLDRLASQGVRFTNTYCSDSPSCPSRAALMSGRFGIHTGLVGHGGTGGDMRLEGPTRGFKDHLARESLAGFLRANGYHTASISPFADRHSAWWFHAGFNETFDSGKSGMESAEEVTPTVLKWLGEHAGSDNWFLHVNYWDPHVPFRVPMEYGHPFSGDPLPAWLTKEEVARHTKLWGKQMMHSKAPVFRRYAEGCRHGIAGITFLPLPRNPKELRTLADVRMVVDGYDTGVRYLDDHVGRVLGALAAAGVLEDTAIIVSADHGENLGELGIYGDHVTADYITHRVPLIIRWPTPERDAAQRGIVDDGLHYQLDLLPTIAALLGHQPPASWEGAILAGAVLHGTPNSRDELVVSACAGTCQRAVRFDDWHYIRTYHDGYNWFPQEMLFDVARDPFEQHNLAAARPEVCADAARRLAAWHQRMYATLPGGADADPLQITIAEGGPSHVRGSLPGYLKWLDDSGWRDAAAELHRRYPQGT